MPDVRRWYGLAGLIVVLDQLSKWVVLENIRFGETIKAYLASPTLDAASLTGIPLALAGWLRYLLGMDDSLAPFDRSGDPLLAELTEKLAAVTVGNPQSVRGQLAPMDLTGTWFATCAESACRRRGRGPVRATATGGRPLC